MVFGAKYWDRRGSKALIESATPCYDAEVVEPYRVSKFDNNRTLFGLTVLTAKPEDYTTAPQHLRCSQHPKLHEELLDFQIPQDLWDFWSFLRKCTRFFGATCSLAIA